MRVTVTGATGTIGKALVQRLLERGDTVAVLSRDADRARSAFDDRVEAFTWDPKSDPPPTESLKGSQAVVHLLGETIAQRWSEDTKREIRDSRVLSTRNLVAGLRAVEERPGV